MKLSEIFAQLTYGELSQLSLGGAEQGVISEANHNQVLAHINLGLVALYKRFPIREGRLNLQLSAGRVTYSLKSSFAVSNRRSREVFRYILDSTAEPFEDDIHKVERVLTASGHELGLNDESDEYGTFTPSSHFLRVPLAIANKSRDLPDALKTDKLEVVYRANHPVIVKGIGLFDPDRVEVELPYSHLEPLLLFVASRIHNPIGMGAEFNAGNNYAAKYEAACQQLEVHNLRVDQGSQNTRFQRGGWV
jgi:hypothetical protein